MPGTRSISGAIVDEDGRPVSAARVVATRPGARTAEGYSTHQGRFAVKGLDYGAYDLRFEPGTRSDWYPPKLTPFVPTTVERVPVGADDLVVRVASGGIVRGVVLGPDGAPLAQAVVAALGPPGVRMAPTAVTGGDGRFELRGVTGDMADVLVSVRGLPPRVLPRADTMEIRIPRGASVRLRLLLPDGSPAAGRMIAVAPRDPGVADRARDWMKRLGDAAQRVHWLSGGAGTTDAQGRVEIGGLDDGAYRLQPVRLEDGLVPDTVLETGGAEVVVRLEVARSVRGLLVDASGNPLGSVPGKRWFVVSSTPPAAAGSAVVAEDGTFELQGLPAGRVRLRIDYSGAAPGFAPTEVEVESGADTVHITVTKQE